MNGRWSFTDLELFALWHDRDQEFLPLPLQFTSRTPLHQDFVHELADTKSDLRRRLGVSFDAVLDALIRPDIHIAVTGWNGRADSDPAGSVALYAARQGQSGYVVTQLTGETIWHSTGFVVEQGDALRLANMVVDRMPKVGAGATDTVPVSRSGMSADGPADYDEEYGTSRVLDTFEDTSTLRSQRLLAAPVDTFGLITVTQGYSRFGPRGICRREIQWRDVEDDGRYVVTPSNPEVASAVDAERLTAVVNTEIAVVVRAIKDERN